MPSNTPELLKSENNTAQGMPKYLVVKIESGERLRDKVNVRIPLALLKAGVKLATFIPAPLQEKINQNLREKGIPFNLEVLQDQKNVDQFLETLRDFHVDIESEKDTIKIFCE